MLIQLIIIQILTFLGIVFILKKMLYTESAREVQRLRKIKEENLEEQKNLQQRIKEAEALYQRKLTEAKEVSAAMRLEALEGAEALKREMMDRAKEEAEAIVKEALNSKEKFREEVTWQMRKGSPALASQIFKEILSEQVKKIIHQELLGEVVKKIEKEKEFLLGAKVSKGELLSAYPLSAADKNRLALVISKKLGYEITMEEKEGRDIICGVVISLGTLVIDASLNNRLKQIEDELAIS